MLFIVFCNISVILIIVGSFFIFPFDVAGNLCNQTLQSFYVGFAETRERTQQAHFLTQQ